MLKAKLAAATRTFGASESKVEMRRLVRMSLGEELLGGWEEPRVSLTREGLENTLHARRRDVRIRFFASGEDKESVAILRSDGIGDEIETGGEERTDDTSGRRTASLQRSTRGNKDAGGVFLTSRSVVAIHSGIRCANVLSNGFAVGGDASLACRYGIIC